MADGGPRSKWDRDWIRRAEFMTARGFTEEELAKMFDVTPQTLWRYKKDKPALARAIARGKQRTAQHIEYSLRRQAMTHDQITVMEDQAVTKDGDLVTTKSRRVEKGVVNIKAAELILRADDPARFSNRVNLAGADGKELVINFKIEQVDEEKVKRELNGSATANP